MNSVPIDFNIKLERMKMSNVGIQIPPPKKTERARNNKTMRIDIAKNVKEIRKHHSVRVNSKNF